MVFGKGLRTLSIATAVVLTGAAALIFFYAPEDADQGIIQKIFYVHVPLAIVALCGFVAGGIMAIKQLRTRSPEWDMRSYVAVHLSLVFATGALITGSIWAKASWGHWWTWDEPVLVSFLIVFSSTAATSRSASRSRTPSARRATPRSSPSPPARSCRSTSWPCAWSPRT